MSGAKGKRKEKKGDLVVGKKREGKGRGTVGLAHPLLLLLVISANSAKTEFLSFFPISNSTKFPNSTKMRPLAILLFSALIVFTQSMDWVEVPLEEPCGEIEKCPAGFRCVRPPE